MGCGASTKVSGKKKPATERESEIIQNKDFERNLLFLHKVPLFKRLPKDELPLLVSECSSAEFQSGEVIIRQGDPGHEFFIIQEGEAEVLIQESPSDPPKKVATLKAGDYFGENALLRETPRNATIAAKGNVVTLKIGRKKFRELGLNDKLVFANRKAVNVGVRALDTHEPSPKTSEERALIEEALKLNQNLQPMVMHDQDKIRAMCDVAWKETVPAGTCIITEGDLMADYFYVIQEGSFKVLQEVENGRVSKGGETEVMVKVVGSLRKGDCFGELALLYLAPRAATVKAVENSVVWVIDRMSFKKIMMKVSEQKLKEYVAYVDAVEILAPLLAEEKRAVAQALVEIHFSRGEVVLQEGEPGSTFYILYEGEVTVYKGGVELTRLTVSKSKGEAKFFGERALLNNEVRAATVVVTSASAKALVLDRESFDLLLGSLEDLLKRQGEDSSRTAKRVQQVNPHFDPNVNREKIVRTDLTRVGLLGCGGFGIVELWEHKSTKETFALKGLNKGYIVKTGMQSSVINEKNILMMTNSPFIIRLWETYNGQKTLYFLLEPALGGELFTIYNRKGFHGSEEHAKFYGAGVVEGFHHLHERRIIYRDLKPENLLLTHEGWLKITDMGLAKFVVGKTYTTCGTPDYFAPELIAATGHTTAVDWWTLGILLFELMAGYPPFEAPHPIQIYSKVMKGKIMWPTSITGFTKEVVEALLVQDPSQRLPMLRGGTQNLREHPWFFGFSWEAFHNQEIDPPFKPKVKSKKDLTNFTASMEDQPQMVEYTDDGSGWDKDFASA